MAKDAFEAFAILRALGTVDVIVLDFELPFVNGLVLYQKLQTDKRLKSIPVIFLTANTDTSLIPENVSFLQKPYKSQEIIHLILSKIAH